MIIAVDFDGTCVAHEYPKIGCNIGSIPVLKRLVESGHKLILWTMRSDDFMGDKSVHGFTSGLTDAVNWFSDNNIPLYGIQRNPTQDEWTSSPKCYAQLFIDDAALGCPLKFHHKSGRYCADWDKIERWLELQGLFDSIEAVSTEN